MRIIPLALTLTLTISTLGAGCATTTKITTDPPGATVTSEKDKKELGKTPLTYETKMWIWESERLTIKAPGRKAKTIEIKRSEFDAGPFLGGACVGLLTVVPCLCLPGGAIIAAGGFKLPEETKVALDKEAGGDPTPPPAALNDEATPESAAVAVRY